ncbi:MAG: hypothetical protein KBB88_00675 [Candidatus Pacebacteria bacterium]|nr:hypothetical protein [Candidatus Paceibacterota bacterium]
MINLLPLSYKEIQFTDWRFRIAIVFLTLCIVVELISIVLLFAPYILVHTKEKVVEAQLEFVQEKISQNGGENYADVVTNTNSLLGYFLNSNTRVRQDNEYVRMVTEASHDGVSIADISIVPSTPPQKSGKSKEEPVVVSGRVVTISGVAINRSVLLAYVDTLKTVEGVSGVNFPVSNFTKSENIDFSISLSVDQAL